MKMRFRRIYTIALATILLANPNVDGALWFIPKDQLRDPTADLPGTGHKPNFGFDIDGNYFYYFTGDTTALRYLSRCAEVYVRRGMYQSYRQVGLKLVVHAGAGFATNPARRPDDKTVDPRARNGC